MKNKPTDKQSEVLDIKNESIIVSASAGSGKTTIMIEKVLRLIRDDFVRVKDILVITFTNAAASEMKQKLINELNEAITVEKDENKKTWLIEQSQEVESANICTIDKFCGTLVKKYFYNVGVNPNYQIMSSESSQVLKDRIFDKLLIEELKRDEEIFNLCDMLAKKRTSTFLKEIVFDYCDFLLVQADFKRYIKEVSLSCYSTPVEDNSCYKYICDYISNAVLKISKKLKECLSVCSNDKLIAYISELSSISDNLTDIINDGKRQFLFDIDLSNFPSKARKNKSMSETEVEVLASVNIIQEKLKKNIPIYRSLLVTPNKEEMEDCLNRASYMIRLLNDFSFKFLDRLNKEKLKINQFDFSDITHFAIDILNNEDIHNDILSEIKCVFVDEFQDVNEIQYTLIKLLSREDNLFLVGDVKQSIYGFRLCDPDIFLEIYNDYKLNNKYKKAKELNENFRSDKYILEFVNDVFCSVMTEENCGFEYAEASKLVPKKEFEKDDNLKKVSVIALSSLLKEEKDKDENKEKLEVYSVAKDEAVSSETIKNANIEAQVIAGVVEEFLQGKIYDGGGMRQVKCSDIAILFRGRGSVYKAVKDVLIASGVNVICEANENLSEELEIKYFNSILKVINNPYDDISLMTVLNFFTGVTFDEFAREKIASDKKHFYEVMFESENEKIVNILNKINYLRDRSKILNVYSLALEVEKEFNLSTLFLALSDGKTRKANFESVLSSLSGQDLSLYDYIYFCENCKEKKNKTASVSEDGITMSTIHSSKGLEYPIVILAGAGENINKKDKDQISYLKDGGVCAASFNTERRKKSDTIALTYSNFIKRKEELSEEMRLLYVALTRAKNHLCIIGDVSKKALEDLSYNVFESQSYLKMVLSSLTDNQLQTLVDSGKVNSKWASFSLVEKSSVCIPKLSKDEFIIFGKADEKLTSEIEKYLSFSYPYSSSNDVARKNTVTELNAKGEEKKISYKINAYKEEAESNGVRANELGTIYHAILEKVDFELVTTMESLISQLGEFSEEELKNVDLKVVYDVITTLKGMMKKGSILHKEKQFLLYAPYNEIFASSDVKDNILIQGVVDLIIENEDSVIIVDYKATKEKRDWVVKQRYKTQLKLYRTAVENAFNKKCKATKIFSIFGGILIDVE